MALVDCRDCGQKVSDSAAACPGCGATRRAYNELNWPGLRMAAVAVVILVTAASLPASSNLLTRLITIVLTGLAIAIAGWDVPYLAEIRKNKKQDKKRTKYMPGVTLGGKALND